MIIAEHIRPGDLFLGDGAHATDAVYVVQSVRVDHKERITYVGEGDADVTEKGSVSILVAFVADGGTDIRRFSIGQETPLVSAAEVTLP